MNSTLVIIPTYNERENIRGLLVELFPLNATVDVLIVDDGQDGTDQLVSEMQKQNFNLFLIKRQKKAGRGSAVLEGLKFGLERKYDYLVEMDADFSHNPAALPALLREASANTVVVGSRYAKGSIIEGWPWRRRIFSKLANVYARLILGIPIQDYTNGYRVYPATLISRVDFSAIQSKGYILLSELAYQLFVLGARFVEVPIKFVNRRLGSSNFSLAEIKEAFFSVLRIRFGNRSVSRRLGP